MQWLIRQRMRVVPFGDISTPQVVKTENGCELKLVSQCNVVLPDVSTTDLGDLVAAGVDLKKVDSAIFGYQGVHVDASTNEPTEEIQKKEE